VRDAAQEVERVRARENVEKAAGLVACDIHALRDQLPQAISCPATNKIPSRSEQPELSETGWVRESEPPPRRFQSKTAGEKNHCVLPKELAAMQQSPHVAAAPQNNECTSEGHEEHQDGDQSDRNCRGVALGRRRLFAAALVAVPAPSPSSPPAGVFRHHHRRCLRR